MPYIEVHVDAREVLKEMDIEEIHRELDRRSGKQAPAGTEEMTDRMLLEKVWMDFRARGNAPESLREYIWRVIGKVL